jgi:hypothetical protein
MIPQDPKPYTHSAVHKLLRFDAKFFLISLAPVMLGGGQMQNPIIYKLKKRKKKKKRKEGEREREREREREKASLVFS